MYKSIGGERMNQIKLVRSRSDRMARGVFGGLAKLIHIDATVLRVIYMLITACTGFIPGIVIYYLCALIIPLEKEVIDIQSSDEPVK